MWTNIYQGGASEPSRPNGLQGFVGLDKRTNKEFQRFCMQWSVSGRYVKWTVDGKQVAYKQTSESFKDALEVQIAYFVGDWTPGGRAWTEQRLTSQIRNIRFRIDEL